MVHLHSASEHEIIEMTRDAKIAMKRPHQKTLLTAWRGLIGGPHPVEHGHSS